MGGCERRVKEPAVPMHRRIERLVVEKHDVEREIRGMFANVGSAYLTCALAGHPPTTFLRISLKTCERPSCRAGRISEPCASHESCLRRQPKGALTVRGGRAAAAPPSRPLGAETLAHRRDRREPGGLTRSSPPRLEW
jgi:hypothetical protein